MTKLEQAILRLSDTENELNTLYYHHGDSPIPMTEDEIANTLLGIMQLHKMRVEAVYLLFKNL